MTQNITPATDEEIERQAPRYNEPDKYPIDHYVHSLIARIHAEQETIAELLGKLDTWQKRSEFLERRAEQAKSTAEPVGYQQRELKRGEWSDW